MIPHEENSCKSAHLDMSCTALLFAPNISKFLPVAAAKVQYMLLSKLCAKWTNAVLLASGSTHGLITMMHASVQPMFRHKDCFVQAHWL